MKKEVTHVVIQNRKWIYQKMIEMCVKESFGRNRTD